MSPFSSRRSRPARGQHAFVLALLAAVSLLTCGGAGDDGDQSARTPDAAASAPSPSPKPALSGHDADAANDMPIQIIFGGTELAARLLHNPTARDLAAQLPLTLTFRDHDNVEKTAPLPRALSADDAPDGHDPAAGDIGYWAPGGDFVLYYDDDARSSGACMAALSSKRKSPTTSGSSSLRLPTSGVMRRASRA